MISLHHEDNTDDSTPDHAHQQQPNRAGSADFLTPGPPALLARVEARLGALSSLTKPDGTTTNPSTPADWFSLLHDAHEQRANGPVSLSTPQAALLLFALQDPYVRDACASWADDAAWWLWLDLIHQAPPGWIAPVATLIGLTAWQQGRTTQARIATEHALADTPDYTLADLLLKLIHSGIEPRSFAEAARKAQRHLGFSGAVENPGHPDLDADSSSEPDQP